MIDLGLLVTGIAALIAFLWGRGKSLRPLLLVSWAVAFMGSALDVNMATTVFMLAAMDLIIAGAALLIVTHDPSRTDAKIIGGISMALMPAHFTMSAAHGAADWTIYAAALNAGFVLQCLIVRGWMDGVGRTANRFWNRLVPVHLHRNGGR